MIQRHVLLWKTFQCHDVTMLKVVISASLVGCTHQNLMRKSSLIYKRLFLVLWYSQEMSGLFENSNFAQQLMVTHMLVSTVFAQWTSGYNKHYGYSKYKAICHQRRTSKRPYLKIVDLACRLSWFNSVYRKEGHCLRKSTRFVLRTHFKQGPPLTC